MRLLSFRDLRYLGKVTFPTSGYTQCGEVQYAQGLALRTVDTERRLAVAFSKATVNEFRLPESLNGTATYLAKLGQPEVENTSAGKAAIWGLHWDEDEPDTLWATSHIDYDTATGNARTVSRSRLTEGVLQHDGFWMCTRHPDKQAAGGVVALPPSFRDQVQGHRLAVGFGGYHSIAATGPASMGQSLSAFTPPETPDGTIDDLPLLGYRYGTDADSNPRQQRPTDYSNDFSDNSGFPQQPTDETGGFWTWADVLLGAGAFVSDSVRWGVLSIGTLGCGRCWYGSNGDGVPSAINSEHMNHCAFLTDPADLARVARGECGENMVQSVFEPIEFPGITYPMPGMPNGVIQKVLALSWADGLLGVMIQKMGPKVANVATPVILFYDLQPSVLPPPGPPTRALVY